MKNRVPPPPFIVDEDLDLRGLFLHLRKGWKLIAALAVLGTLVGLLLTSLMGPVYRVYGVVRIPRTWDLAARDPASLVASALRTASISKGRGVAVARMIPRDISGEPLFEPGPVQLFLSTADVESGRRRLEDFLAEANRAPEMLKLAAEAQTMARQEIERVDNELASGRAADTASLIERRQILQRALDRDSALGWDLQPRSDGRDVGQSQATLILIGTFLGLLLGVLGALARWPRFMVT